MKYSCASLFRILVLSFRDHNLPVFLGRHHFRNEEIKSPSAILNSSDVRPSNDLTFKGFSLNNRARLNFQVYALSGITMAN